MSTWAEAMKNALSLPRMEAAEALRQIELGLTDENDCSTFYLTISAGPYPVTVDVTPDQVRRVLRSLSNDGA